jgi:hypothetical protein
MHLIVDYRFYIIKGKSEEELPRSLFIEAKKKFYENFHTTLDINGGLFVPEDEYFYKKFEERRSIEGMRYLIEACYRLGVNRADYPKCKKSAKAKFDKLAKEVEDYLKAKFSDIDFEVDTACNFATNTIQYDDPSERPKRKFYKAVTNLMLLDDFSGPDEDVAYDEYEDRVETLLKGLSKNAFEKDGRKVKISDYDFDEDIVLEVSISGADSPKDAEDAANEFSERVLSPAIDKIIDDLVSKYDVEVDMPEGSFTFEEDETLYN